VKPELFHEIYGRYFKIVSKLLKLAENAPLTFDEIRRVTSEMGYEQTSMILPDLVTQGTIKFKNKPPVPRPSIFDEQDGKFVAGIKSRTRPLSLLERRWLAAVLRDKRMRLFMSEEKHAMLEDQLKDVEPLFRENDFYKVDESREPDRFDGDTYRRVFKTVLSALRTNSPLELEYSPEAGSVVRETVYPSYLEYSSRDDNFRLLCRTADGEKKAEKAINIREIVFAQKVEASSFAEDDVWDEENEADRKTKLAKIEIKDERGAVERALLHFANYKTHASVDFDDKITLELHYLKSDEPELADRILAFGPLVRVHKPDSLLRQIRKRTAKQMELLKMSAKTSSKNRSDK
jgi:predicted DNA-binding transcriptional regulator YafY